jgi:hypothetical protein
MGAGNLFSQFSMPGQSIQDQGLNLGAQNGKKGI